MLDRVKREIERLRRLRVRKKRAVRIPEGSQSGGPEHAERAPDVTPTNRHDGWSEIRPRRPGEDTSVGLRPVDITSPGKELRPVEGNGDDDDD